MLQNSTTWKGVTGLDCRGEIKGVDLLTEDEVNA